MATAKTPVIEMDFEDIEYINNFAQLLWDNVKVHDGYVDSPVRKRGKKYEFDMVVNGRTVSITVPEGDDE